MKVFLMKWKHTLGILSIPIQGLIYVWISRNIGPNVYLDYFWIDTKIPFVSWFVLPYMSWMPVLYLSFIYLAVVNHKIYWRTLAIYNLSVIASNLCFLFFATYVPRPTIESTDLANMLVNFIYQNDAPYNCFPSIHCLTSYLLFITLNRDINTSISLRIIFTTLLWLIIVSTVLIKQHSLLDVVGAIVFAEITYRLVNLASSRYMKQKELLSNHF